MWQEWEYEARSPDGGLISRVEPGGPNNQTLTEGELIKHLMDLLYVNNGNEWELIEASPGLVHVGFDHQGYRAFWVFRRLAP